MESSGPVTGDLRARPVFGESLARLGAAQKTARGAPIYSLLVNRPLGRVIAAAAHVVGLTPNQVTAISAAVTYTGIVLIAVLPPSWAAGLGIAGLLVLGYALDAADGQLARLRGGGSLAGEWLDHVIDSGKIATLHLAVAVMVSRSLGLDPVWTLVPLAFSAVGVVHFFGMLLTELLGRLHAAGTTSAGPPARASMVMSVAKLPTDYGLLCLSFVLLGLPMVFFLFYTVLAVATVGYTSLVLVAWYRRVAQLD